VFKIGGAITWQSKRQQTVALSTTETEYMALTQATKEALWLKALFESIGVKMRKPLAILADNQGAIKLARNQEFHQRTKHIDIQYHFIREKLERKEVTLAFVGTKQMVADGLTKALGGTAQSISRAELGVVTLQG